MEKWIIIIPFPPSIINYPFFCYMKKSIYTVIFFFFFVQIQAFALDASITHASYKGIKENYIEFNIYIVGKTVEWVQLDTTETQASIEIGIFFKQKGQIMQFDKFAMKSPKRLKPINFEDIRRYALANGAYDIEITLKDMNKAGNTITYKSAINVDYVEDMLRQSDIQLLDYIKPDTTEGVARVKHGYFMEALPFNFYDKTHSTLIFFNEVYNTDKAIGDDFLVSYSVQKLFGQPTDRPLLIAHKRKKPAAFIVNLMQLDISSLTSGNYRLVVSIRNRANELLSEKEVMFQRSNPNLEIKVDTLTVNALSSEFVGQLQENDLRYALKSIIMKVPEMDVVVINEMLKTKDLMAQRRYLFQYFAKISPNLPKEAYDEYLKVVKAVDRMYNSGFGYGFDTDRGRIYLKYGRPNDIITVENEMSAPPYEIWVYNKVEKTQQTNIKFLFYNPNLVVNGYRQLHSTCRGETNNPRWVTELYKGVPNEQTGSLIDGNGGVQRNFNRRAVELMNDN